MLHARSTPIPPNSALAQFQSIDGGYADCFSTLAASSVPLSAFINVFFDTWVFRMERRLLSVTGKGRAKAQDVAALAHAETERFAAWRVVLRDETQLLMEVPATPIRTWLAVENMPQTSATRLFFGSGLVPRDGSNGLSWGIRASIGAHRVYSRILLTAATRKLRNVSADALTRAEG